MSDTLVNSENYFVVSGWMISDLGLSGNTLMVYAIIYGFTQNINKQKFAGGLRYLAEWTNSTKQGVTKNLKELLERGLIEKEDECIDGIKHCYYRATKLNAVSNRVEWGMQQSSTGGMQQSCNSNKYKNNIERNIEGNIEPSVESLSEARVGVASDSDRTDYQAVINLYHELCPSFRRVLKLSAERKRHIKARFSDGYTLQDFEDMFRKAEMSSFLKGWKGCDFDWLITDRAMPKVLEGKYDNVESPKEEEPQTFGGFVLQ